ncbi:auxin-responsive protein SAUR71-like [Nymphaea colorata]|uniref:auxin-responsive protein SAUR71-like n=1 Tax=Nymphaea colorata TaxID=210225 RepID=UPI00129D91F0|nr:auxin-responsive protein SAUR71-like [Nymphaea colorata]
MKQLLRKLSKLADSPSASYVLLRSESAAPERNGRRSSSSSSCGGEGDEGGCEVVPEGHLPVCVGEEMERFVVSAESLNHPLFAELLRLSAQEYGYDQKGVLRIPCPAGIFRTILDILRRTDGVAVAAGVDLENLLLRLAAVGSASS